MQTLLLADDSATIQRVIELTFAEEDIQIVTVGDAEQVIQRLESAPPDIVLADVAMPGRDGYELARYVKQSTRLSHIPVLLLTGPFESIDQSKAAEVGCAGVLTKPFEPQLVIERVRELLASGAARAQAQVATSTSAPIPPAPPVPPRRVPLPPSSASGQPPFTPGPSRSSGAVAPLAASELDDYFDRLDAAIATRQAGTQGSAPDPSLSYGSPRNAFDRLDDLMPDQSSTGNPSSIGSPDLPAPPPFAGPFATPDAVSTQAVAAPRHAEPKVSVPPIVEAFGALLDAEKRAQRPMSRPEWPIVHSSVDVTDEMADKITERVLQTLTDRVVRETVAEIVSQVADRLVREEIERLKASLK